MRDALDVAGLMRAHVLALLPCLLLGALGIGRGMLHVAREAGGLPPGWRTDVLAGLGLPTAPEHVPAAATLGLLHLLPLVLVAYVTNAAWERLFARLRDRDPLPGTLLQALVFALLVPPSLAFVPAAVAMSFGVVLGKEVFGGTGRNLVHPSVAAVAFLLLAWPGAMRGAMAWVGLPGSTTDDLLVRAAADAPAAAVSPLAVVLGGSWLLLRRLVAWRTIAAVIGGALATALAWRLAGPYPSPLAHVALPWHLALGSLLFGAFFLATDPITCPVTDAGRWIHGVLLGGIVVLLRIADPSQPEGTVLAVLLGNVFAPLNDAFVIALHPRGRRRRA